MHNIKYIRSNPEEFDNKMARRGFEGLSKKILELDSARKESVGSLQELQEESNRLAKQIGELMAQGKREEAQDVIAKSKEVKAKLQAAKDSGKNEDKGSDNSDSENNNDELTNFLLTIPNIMADDVPDGKDEDDNVEVKTWGTPREFNFEPKAHYDLGEELNLLDFEDTAKISGARFATSFGNISRLSRALANFMIDNAVNNFGYLEASPPYLVKAPALVGTSQLPKFEEDLFKTEEGFYLIPTAEVPLTNLVRESILEEKQLPLRYTAFTPCFRSEAGSAGRDTRGLIRMHQFDKVELVSITKPEDSHTEHERLSSCAESILEQLELPYRKVVLCSGDTGFGSNKTYDLEVFLPAQGKYREISSCSNCLDFQSRRMNARMRRNDSGKIEFVHTLNGSALAVGRTLVAIMENYQNEDGSITVPEVLRGYMNGLEKIEVNKK